MSPFLQRHHLLKPFEDLLNLLKPIISGAPFLLVDRNTDLELLKRSTMWFYHEAPSEIKEHEDEHTETALWGCAPCRSWCPWSGRFD